MTGPENEIRSAIPVISVSPPSQKSSRSSKKAFDYRLISTFMQA